MGVSFAMNHPDEGRNSISPVSQYRNFALMLISVAALPLILWSATTEYAAFIPIAIIVLVGGIISFRSPIVALCVIILFHIIILEPTEGISIGEIVFGIYFFGYLTFWFFNKIFIQHEKILQTIPDVFLISYVAMCFVSIVMALVLNTSILKWFREFLTIASLLLYFPAREALKSERNVKIAGAAFIGLVLVFALKNIWQYRTASLAASYLWEVLGSRKPHNAHLFFGGSVVMAGLFIHARSLKLRLLFGSVMSIVLVGLIVSFTRGFWIATLIGLGFLFLFLDADKRKSFLLFSTAGTASAVVVVSVFFPHVSSFLLQTIIHRFTSSGSAFEDMSVIERVVESRAAIHEIMQSPLVGHGFGSTFSFYNILDKSTVTTWYIHNAYLFLLYKVGVIGAFLFLGFYAGVISEGLSAAKKLKNGVFDREINITVVAVFIGMLAVALTSNMFIEKESLLMISFGGAIIMSSWNRHVEEIA
jgi:O-antigen ligase